MIIRIPNTTTPTSLGAATIYDNPRDSLLADYNLAYHLTLGAPSKDNLVDEGFRAQPAYTLAAKNTDGTILYPRLVERWVHNREQSRVWEAALAERINKTIAPLTTDGGPAPAKPLA